MLGWLWRTPKETKLCAVRPQALNNYPLIIKLRLSRGGPLKKTIIQILKTNKNPLSLLLPVEWKQTSIHWKMNKYINKWINKKIKKVIPWLQFFLHPIAGSSFVVSQSKHLPWCEEMNSHKFCPTSKSVGDRKAQNIDKASREIVVVQNFQSKQHS